MSDEDNGFRFTPATADQPPVTAVPAPSVEPVAAVPTTRKSEAPTKPVKRSPNPVDKYKPYTW